MPNFYKTVWLSWHYAARSRNLAKVLNIPILEYFNNKNALQRHALSSFWTIWMLFKHRPKVVVIQLSFMLLNLVAIYKIFTFGKTVIIVDCHTKALRRKAKGVLNKIFWPIKRFTFSLVNLSIISNNGMKKDIDELHNNYLILPDKIPENIIKTDPNKSEKYCVYISAFAVDEPFEEIFEVAKLLKDELDIYWTGKRPKSLPLPEEVPENLKFTGFISFEDYYNLIGNSDCVLALTTEEDCLQSGAYEALNVEVPMVITDSFALREYFDNSAVYTNHEPEQIAKNILKAIENSSDQINNIKRIKELRNAEFFEKIDKIEELLK